MLHFMNSRRDFCLTLPALALLMEATAEAQQPDRAEPVLPSAAHDTNGTELLKHNQVFRADKLPIKQSAVGSSQAVVHGTLVTGESVELHNTVLLAGHEPHPPHQHPHAEFLFLKEGQVDWLIDGQHQPALAGDILYAASNVLHGLRNTGTVPAKYFVLAIGPNLKA